RSLALLFALGIDSSRNQPAFGQGRPLGSFLFNAGFLFCAPRTNAYPAVLIWGLAIPKAERERLLQADVLCRHATPLLVQEMLCVSNHPGRRGFRLRHWW